MSIQSLLNQIERNEIILPAIQRSFVWEEERIIRLFDSVMRKYPVGIVLLWETFNNIQYRIFDKVFNKGDIFSFQDNSDLKRVKLVLDGQQRLQSLYLALYGNFTGKYLYFDILSGKDTENVAEERYKFEFLDPDEAKKKNTWMKEKFSNVPEQLV